MTTCGAEVAGWWGNDYGKCGSSSSSMPGPVCLQAHLLKVLWNLSSGMAHPDSAVPKVLHNVCVGAAAACMPMLSPGGALG